MKYKVHKLLQIITIVIIVFAAYASFKQVEGFQAPPDAIPNSATLTVLLNSTGTNPPPAWLTSERTTGLKNLADLAIMKGFGGPDDKNYQEALNKAFTDSKAKGDKDDITLDNVIKAGTDYANNYTTPITNSATLQELFNVINPDPKPAWYTTERANALKKLGELAKEKGVGGPDDKAYNDAMNKAFTDSKAKGDKDDVTFDKVIKAGTDYANNSGSSNLPLYIGATVGGVAVLGTVGYLIFSGPRVT